jgi:hypothetical protein
LHYGCTGLLAPHTFVGFLIRGIRGSRSACASRTWESLTFHHDEMGLKLLPLIIGSGVRVGGQATCPVTVAHCLSSNQCCCPNGAFRLYLPTPLGRTCNGFLKCSHHCSSYEYSLAAGDNRWTLPHSCTHTHELNFLSISSSK